MVAQSSNIYNTMNSNKQQAAAGGGVLLQSNRAVESLHAALGECNARIESLEWELARTKCLLAASKTNEDTLQHELHKMKAELHKTTKGLIDAPQAREVSSDEADKGDGFVMPTRAMATTTRRLPSALRSSANFTKRRVVNSFTTVGGASSNNDQRMPLGEPIMHTTRSRTTSLSRKRSSSALNPGSCGSALNLLAANSDANNMNSALNSSSSINRMLKEFGLNRHDSSLPLKRRTSRGEVSRLQTTATSSSQSNEGWGDCTLAKPCNNTAQQRQENLFANILQSSTARRIMSSSALHATPTAAGIRPGSGLKISAQKDHRKCSSTSRILL